MSNCDDNPRISPRVILQWVVFLVMHSRDFHSLRRSLPGMLIGAGLVFAVGIGITSPRGTEQLTTASTENVPDPCMRMLVYLRTARSDSWDR